VYVEYIYMYVWSYMYIPHQNLLGTKRVSNPATRKDLAAMMWGVFWYTSICPFSSKLMVQIKQKSGHGVENLPPKSFWCAYSRYLCFFPFFGVVNPPSYICVYISRVLIFIYICIYIYRV